jgi:cytidylate kinase
MTVWTIDAELGTDGTEIARGVAKRAGVPLVDRQFALALALALGMTVDDARELNEEGNRTLVRAGLIAGMITPVGPLAAAELSRLDRRREVLSSTARKAATAPCVIVGRCAYAILADHPAALHVRIVAPRRWRARHLASTACIPLRRARRELARSERRRRSMARQIFGRNGRSAAGFHIVLDASRLAPDAMVDLLLAVGTHVSPVEDSSLTVLSQQSKQGEDTTHRTDLSRPKLTGPDALVQGPDSRASAR